MRCLAAAETGGFDAGVKPRTTGLCTAWGMGMPAPEAGNIFTSIRTNNVIHQLPHVKEHFDKAWAAKPGLDSIGDLAREAENLTPFLRQLPGLDIDFPRLHAQLLSVLDNFAEDEIVATLAVMWAAVGLAYVLSTGAGLDRVLGSRP